MILMAITWLLLGMILGAVAFFAGGFVVSLVGGDDVQDKVGRWYVDMAMAAQRNAALVVRETGQLAITSVQFDPKFGGDRAVIGGVMGHWPDPLEVKSTLAGKPFGIAPEGAAAYISPIMAEIGEVGSDRLDSGQLGQEVDSKGNEKVKLDFKIAENPQIMDLRAALSFLEGSCKRRWGSVANKFGQLSQEKFHERFSLGQSMLWMGAFALGVGLGFIVIKYGSGAADGGSVSVPMIAMSGLLAMPDEDNILTSTTAKMVYVGVAAVILAVAVVGIAFAGWGVWSAVAAAVGLVVGLSAPWIYVRVLFTPALAGMISAAFFILAQVTFGAGALVRRDDGGYEWVRLQQDDSGLFAELSNGSRVDIDGEVADLPNVAWAPLAIAEQKTEENMSQWTVGDDWRDSRPDPQSHGEEMVDTPLAIADGGDDSGWHLDSSKLNRWTRGSAGNELPRNGVRKALEEDGGQQQISPLITMIGAGVLSVVGFGSTALVLML